MWFFNYIITTLWYNEGFFGFFVLFLFILYYLCLPGFQEKHGSYYMFSANHLLNPQFHANETEETELWKIFQLLNIHEANLAS